MDFNCSSTIKYPVATVWAAMRDHLHTIAEQQDDIAYVIIDKRANKKPNFVQVISTWQADPPLPAFIKGFIKPEMLVWTDETMWDNDTHTASFDIVTHYKVEDITCVGTITYEPVAKGKHTKVTFSGVFTIAKTNRSSIFLTGFVIKGIEAVAGTLIENNFDRVIKTTSDFLAGKK